MYSSIRGSTAAKNAPSRDPIIPSAFAKKKNTFAPPPKRTVSGSGSASATTSTFQHDDEEQEVGEEAEEQEAEGEWAEALYDYASDETGDLKLRARQRVLVTEKTSDDWYVICITTFVT